MVHQKNQVQYVILLVMIINEILLLHFLSILDVLGLAGKLIKSRTWS